MNALFLSTRTGHVRLLRPACFGIVLAWLQALTLPHPADAQEPETAAANGRLGVFLECTGEQCGEMHRFFRTEITWVDWVRNREDSDVHVIVTSQRTGSGGRQYQLDFIGRRTLEAADDQLFFRSLGSDVAQEAFDGLTTTLAIGLARYASLAGLRGFVTIGQPERDAVDPDERVLSPQEVNDPWNLWVFTVGASGSVEDTDKFDTNRFSANLAASRTTPTWRVAFSLRGNRNVIETLLSDSTIFTSRLTDFRADANIVYGFADHWSAGLFSNAAKEPKNNQALRLQVLPAIEYSYFPYPEATRRSLAARYAIGPVYRDYDEMTIFGRTEETRFDGILHLRYSHRQPWGAGWFVIMASHQLDDLDKHNVVLWGNLSFRIARGLSLNAGGNASWVTNQIYLSAGGETDEEVLLDLRTRASTFNYGINVGLSFRFGSIYNNVVNNRFASFVGF